MNKRESSKIISITDFSLLFPTDDACLEHLMQQRYGWPAKLDCPKCQKNGRFTRIKKEPAYQCAWCSHHIHPMAGTPFQNSRTPLTKWFHALYLFTRSRNGISAKELARYLDVSYKVAWRLGHQVRQYMIKTKGRSILSGIIEVDETYIGGKRPGKRGRGAGGKTIVVGLLEKGGSISTQIVPDVKRKTLHPVIEEKVAKGSTLHTDELPSYRTIAERGYAHETVNHGAGEYARNGVHVNGLEGFWSLFKRSIRGTHVSVSPQHLEKYLGEFEYRYNLRKHPEIMLTRLLTSF